MNRLRWLLPLVLGFAHVEAQELPLEITIVPPRGTLDCIFTISITNRGTEAFGFEDCCSFPRITSLAHDQLLPLCIQCDPCPPVPQLNGILPPAGFLTHEWQPGDATCGEDWIPTPGLYEVQWTGFPAIITGRFEILPDPARSLELNADPHEVRFGEPTTLIAQNTTTSDLCLEAARQNLSIMDARGFESFCEAPPLCGPARCCGTIPPGEERPFTLTAGEHPCREENLPGPHRIILTVLDQNLERYHGETTVLILPPTDQRLELTLSSRAVAPGDVIEITATNPLEVPVWYDRCCDEVIFIDELGRESPCSPCVKGCRGGRSLEIPPGGSISKTKLIGGGGNCGLEPGRWSVIWGRHFGLEPGTNPTTPVFGYSEVLVLTESGVRFLRGDCNDDGDLNISDPVCILNWLFLGGPIPGSGCVAVANTDGSETNDEVDLSDGVYLLNHLFLGGPAPTPPFPKCRAGILPSDEEMCETSPNSCP